MTPLGPEPPVSGGREAVEVRTHGRRRLVAACFGEGPDAPAPVSSGRLRQLVAGGLVAVLILAGVAIKEHVEAGARPLPGSPARTARTADA